MKTLLIAMSIGCISMLSYGQEEVTTTVKNTEVKTVTNEAPNVQREEVSKTGKLNVKRIERPNKPKSQAPRKEARPAKKSSELRSSNK